MKTICIDFDGVLHSYKSGWKGADVIPDEPVKGAIEWLLNMLKNDELQPVIYSARSSQDGGIEAMRGWLIKNGLPSHYIERGQLGFPVNKPPAWITIDDRVFNFKGIFPETKEIIEFKPWTGKDL